ncbi:hypothetical protein SADUNF_Sadunf03G0145400 [Salix dunnii]|uniref:Uncharacterized protein n=1 Tax=Salix dunnii TaxID=1413687 RepID=A0A835TEY2_9ROSI|nr:hypothetical protein SADUNF_Sadunf03G0145400 [Salix dunnii]
MTTSLMISSVMSVTSKNSRRTKIKIWAVFFQVKIMFMRRVLFISKFLRLSKLHNLDISSITPSFSSFWVKGIPRNSASFFKLKVISSFKSSYFKNSTLSGL